MRSGIAVGKRPMGTGIPLGYHEGERVMAFLHTQRGSLLLKRIFLKNNHKLWIFTIFI